MLKKLVLLYFIGPVFCSFMSDNVQINALLKIFRRPRGSKLEEIKKMLDLWSTHLPEHYSTQMNKKRDL